MHGLQGAEAQGPKLERGPTGCKEIIFFKYFFIWEFAAMTTAFCKQTHTHIFSDTLVVVAYIVNGSVQVPPTQFV